MIIIVVDDELYPQSQYYDIYYYRLYIYIYKSFKFDPYIYTTQVQAIINTSYYIITLSLNIIHKIYTVIYDICITCTIFIGTLNIRDY